jgi:hypothetical protein
MNSTEIKRGFPTKQLTGRSEPRVKQDEGGHFVYTISENIKVYFDDYYEFLEGVEARALTDLQQVTEKLATTSADEAELTAYLFAHRGILRVLISTIYDFYSDSKNFGVIMTPWCFGTVVLEKVENYRERLSRGDVDAEELPDYPYDVVRYLDEIHRKVLLDLFQFPEQAFAMRWQYSELLKRYSKALSGITNSLHSVMMLVKSYGS